MIYSNFNRIVDSIYRKSPLQKKKLEKYLSVKDDRFFQEAEDFATSYLSYLTNQNVSLVYAVDAYLKMCNDMMKSQIHFMKTGHYPIQSSMQASDNVYKNEKEMKSYMIGLAISQFLWATHYEMYKFFEDQFQKKAKEVNSYAEIGPGHGLFLNKALDCLEEEKPVVVIDISPVSMDITRSIISYFRPERHNIVYCNVDILDFETEESYDFITMGEVLEHVNYPENLLMKLNNLLARGANAFISTCVNAPAIDHVYHFKKVEEIRKMFRLCNFVIENELVLPVEDLPMDEIIEKKITINYCAIIAKGELNEKN